MMNDKECPRNHIELTHGPGASCPECGKDLRIPTYLFREARASVALDGETQAIESWDNEGGTPPTGDKERLCPNCVTPWKCNGPHIPEPTGDRGERPEDVPAILRVLERDVNGWHDLPQADYEAALMEYHALVAERDERERPDWGREFVPYEVGQYVGTLHARIAERDAALAAERVRGDREKERADAVDRALVGLWSNNICATHISRGCAECLHDMVEQARRSLAADPEGGSEDGRS